MLFLECCCTSVEEVLEAEAGGAGRVELCSELEVGGVTPSLDLIRSVLAATSLPVNVLVRPRGGDFVFSEDETESMLRDIDICKSLGVNGVVIGALDRDGNIDLPLMRRLISAARPLKVTFHRAFDECADPSAALEDIISLGCDILLTSGHAPSAYEGRALISRLILQAAGRIIIMPGAGIKPANINEISLATGALQFHGSSHGPAGTTDCNVVRAITQNVKIL